MPWNDFGVRFWAFVLVLLGPAFFWSVFILWAQSLLRKTRKSQTVIPKDAQGLISTGIRGTLTPKCLETISRNDLNCPVQLKVESGRFRNLSVVFLKSEEKCDPCGNYVLIEASNPIFGCFFWCSDDADDGTTTNCIGSFSRLELSLNRTSRSK